MELPDFAGHMPEAFRLTFKGSTENLTEAFDVDEPVTLVVRGKIKDPSFKTNQFGVMRLVESLDVDFATVADDVTAERVALAAKAHADAKAGQSSLDDDIDAQTGQENGDDDG